MPTSRPRLPPAGRAWTGAPTVRCTGRWVRTCGTGWRSCRPASIPYVHLAAALAAIEVHAKRAMVLTDPNWLLVHTLELLDLTVSGWEFGRVLVSADAAAPRHPPHRRRDADAPDRGRAAGVAARHPRGDAEQPDDRHLRPGRHRDRRHQRRRGDAPLVPDLKSAQRNRSACSTAHAS